MRFAQSASVIRHVASGVILASGLAAAAGSEAVAQTSQRVSQPAGSPQRFTMHPADGGMLRLDTHTGTLSMCKQTGGSWSCTMLPDDRAAVADEIERLRAENTELKSAVKRLEDMAGLPAEGPKKSSGLQLPTEKDIDEAMGYMERMLKKFKDKIKEFEGTDGKKGTPL